MSKQSKHIWRFFKAGGVYQASLNRGADLANIGELDPKLWSALSCPTKGLEFDARTLELLDTDGDGKIRRPEVIAACEWACAALKNPDILACGGDALPLSEFNEASDIGKALLASAKHILNDLGKPDAKEISLGDVADTRKIFNGTRFNADGIITVGTAGDDAALASVIADILSVSSPKADRSGDPGVDADAVKAFCAAVRDFDAWQKSADTATLPLGEETAGAYALVCELREKIEDYFTRCALVRYDAAALPQANASAAQFADILAADFDAKSAKLAALPLAAIAEGAAALPLDASVNPAWAEKIKALRETVAAPILGADVSALTRGDWQKILAAFAPYAAWLGAKKGALVEPLGAARVAEIAKLDPEAKLLALIDEDLALKPQFDHIQNVERLLRYRSHLHEFLCNYVNFRAFYRAGKEADFQCGRLFIDQRECALCVPVNDPAKHAALASMSYFYLLYCECTRKGEAPRQIAAAMTTGDCDNLIVGRNGVFFDRQGRDWDATVTRIVENPIGIAQAFWLPYKRAMKWINEQIAKRASAADSNVTKSLEADLSDPAKAVPAKKIDVGTVAALGVAVGGITAAFGAILQSFFGLGVWMPLGVLGIILAISLPSMVLAWLKLRLRNLAPLLDANGWAVNSKSLVNIMLGARLTRAAKLPRRAVRERSLDVKKSHWKLWTVLILAIVLAGAIAGWRLGLFCSACEHEAACAAEETVVIVEAEAAAPAQEAPAEAQ